MSHDTQDDGFGAGFDYEANLHNSPLEDLDQATLDWLTRTDTSLATIAKVERLRDERSDAYAALIDALSDDTKASILRFLCFHRTGTTYGELIDVTPTVSERTVRSKVADLADDGVLSVGDGKPASIDFEDDAVRLLAGDMLSYYSKE